MRVLIIRPEREATALATALAERGHTPVIAPLFRLEFLHPPAEFSAALAALALPLAVGYLLSWISALIGLTVGDPETAGTASLLPVIPLAFTSSTFVPVATMPGWLQAWANINPIK